MLFTNEDDGSNVYVGSVVSIESWEDNYWGAGHHAYGSDEVSFWGPDCGYDRLGSMTGYGRYLIVCPD